VLCTGSGLLAVVGIDSPINNMTVTVGAGAEVKPVLLTPYAVNLTGVNTTFINNGTVDPTLLLGLGLLTSGCNSAAAPTARWSSTT
jgi:hypothetical protein